MKTEATVTVPYKEYSELIAELNRLTVRETERKHKEMGLVELTVNGHLGPNKEVVVTGAVVIDGETTELSKEYSPGSLLLPVFRMLIREIHKVKNAVVLVDSNIRKVEQSIQTLSIQDRDIYVQIRRVADENNLILISRKQKGSEP